MTPGRDRFGSLADANGACGVYLLWVTSGRNATSLLESALHLKAEVARRQLRSWPIQHQDPDPSNDAAMQALGKMGNMLF